MMSNADRESSLKLYMQEVMKTELLSSEEEYELALRVEKGDKVARTHMIKANLRLVVKIANGYLNNGLSLQDLVSEGNIGLMTAVERFDPDRGVKLSTYAAFWIKQSIRRALSNQSKTIRLPVHVSDKLSKMRKIAAFMVDDLGREPTDTELSEELGISRAKLAILKQSALNPSSLDAPVQEGEGTNFGDLLQDSKAIDPSTALSEKNMHQNLDDVIEVLNEREQHIIEARFGLNGQQPKTLEEVGTQFGLTRERIRQVQNIALKKMKSAFTKLDRKNVRQITA